jgi:N12 class adenine-specific DNA methylase
MTADPVTLGDFRTTALGLAQAGVDALEALHEIDAAGPGARPTAEQRARLARWPGWGPLAPALERHVGRGGWRDITTRLAPLLTKKQRETAFRASPNAFYTSPLVAEAMWRAACRLGFSGGKTLELGCGAGRFIAAAPDSVALPLRWTGVEADESSAQICRLLHPAANIIGRKLERVSLRPDTYDLVIGNVPFGQAGPYDPSAPDGLNLHGYFHWRALHAVRPGGLVMQVTSRYLMDNKGDTVREHLAELGSFLGAVRLPSGAFDQQGTSTVVDVLVWRRRTGNEPHAAPWLTVEYSADLWTDINSYWRTHPQQVLGTIKRTGGAAYGQTLEVLYDGDQESLARDLAAALDRIREAAGEHDLAWLPPAPLRPLPADEDAADDGPDGRKENSFHIDPQDGGVVQIRGGLVLPVTDPPAELRHLIRLRDAASTLLHAESNHATPDADLAPARAAVNELYDAYTAKWGALNRCTLKEGQPDKETGDPTWRRTTPTLGGFRGDPDCMTVLQIEEHDDWTGEHRKAPILLRRVNRATQRPERAADPDQAVARSLDETGGIDLHLIGRLLGISALQAPAVLGERIFEDPAKGCWVPAEEYLSGRVRDKLREAMTAALDDKDRYLRNIEALEPVQPPPLGPEQIDVYLGAPWIPRQVIAEFIRETLHAGARVVHIPEVALWEVDYNQYGVGPLANAEWGTPRINAFRLIELALNNAAPIVKDKVKDGGYEREIKNAAETQLAEAKQQALQERFGQWVWEDQGRMQHLTALYNERFNSVVLRRYSGSHLTFPGMQDGFRPYQHQRDTIWRIICNPAQLCWHEVGGGKTFSFAGAALKMRELGLVSKPAVTVPNHLLEQTCAEVRRRFPAAKVLMVTKDDLNPARRRAFAAKCATGDYDLIVFTHEGFTSLPVRPETEADYVRDLIEKYKAAQFEASDQGARATKRIANQVLKLEARLAKLLDGSADVGVCFEDTGIDYVMVDEAHLFLALPIVTRAEGFSFRSSKRATHLQMVLTWLAKVDEETGGPGRCGALFTGTAIKNTLAEAFVLLTYLMPRRLTELQVDQFDAWAALFVRWLSNIEVRPDGGGFRMHRRPARFANMPELLLLLGDVADIRPGETLPLDVPDVEYQTVATDASPAVLNYVSGKGGLVDRADWVRNGHPKVFPPNPKHRDKKRRDKEITDNHLLVCNHGRQVALHPSLVGLEDDQPGKVDACIAKAAEIYHETKNWAYPDPDAAPTHRKDGTPALFSVHPEPGAMQVVFCDLGVPQDGDDRVYGLLRDGLIAAGVPAERIRIAQNAKTDKAKAQLHADCRAGKVSVLIGSTAVLGTGVNIQPRLYAIHHLDAPWRPDEVMQRDGRGRRPGNLNHKILVFRYVTRRTFDAYMWETLERKIRFISQVLAAFIRMLQSGTVVAIRDMEDVGPVVLDWATIKAEAAGQPLLRRQVELTARIRELRTLQSGHARTQRRTAEDYEHFKEQAKRADEAAARYAAMAAAMAKHTGPEFTNAHRTPITDPKEKQETLARAAADAIVNGTRMFVGQWRGADMEVKLVDDHPGRRPYLRFYVGYTFTARITIECEVKWVNKRQQHHLIGRITAELGRLEQDAARERHLAAEARQRSEQAKAIMGQPFPQEEELSALMAERHEIDTQIHDTAAA